MPLTNWSAETFPVALERYDFLGWFSDILVSGAEKAQKTKTRPSTNWPSGALICKGGKKPFSSTTMPTTLPQHGNWACRAIIFLRQRPCKNF